MYRAIPKAELWVMPGAGHAEVYGKWRALFAEVALGFLGVSRCLNR